MPPKRLPKGELEINRKEAGSDGGERGQSRARGPATRKTARAVRPAPQIAGEKTVRRTGASVPVARSKTSPDEQGPTVAAAIDRRRQVTGTDELPGRKKTGGRRG
jgi:hypothetical protein